MTYSVKDLCERFGVSEHTVYQWIHTGELVAFNVAKTLGVRPKWRVSAEAVIAFEQSRSATPSAPQG